MKLNVDLGNSDYMAIDVEHQMKIEDVIALLTVQNTHLDYDKTQLFYNGKLMLGQKRVQDYQLYEDSTIQVKIKANSGCCTIF